VILKIFGSFLIISSSYIYGVLKYGDMKKEVKILKEFSDNLVYLKNEICFAKSPLCGIIGNLSEKDGILITYTNDNVCFEDTKTAESILLSNDGQILHSNFDDKKISSI